MTKQIIFIFALLCTLQAQASVQPVQKDTVRHTIYYEKRCGIASTDAARLSQRGATSGISNRQLVC